MLVPLVVKNQPNTKILLILWNFSVDSGRVVYVCLFVFNFSSHCLFWKQTNLAISLSFTGFRFFVFSASTTQLQVSKCIISSTYWCLYSVFVNLK